MWQHCQNTPGPPPPPSTPCLQGASLNGSETRKWRKGECVESTCRSPNLSHLCKGRECVAIEGVVGISIFCQVGWRIHSLRDRFSRTSSPRLFLFLTVLCRVKDPPLDYPRTETQRPLAKWGQTRGEELTRRVKGNKNPPAFKKTALRISKDSRVHSLEWEQQGAICVPASFQNVDCWLA